MGDVIRDASTTRTLAGQSSFTLKFRIARLVWLTCWLLLAAWTPRPFFGWRRMLLRAFGAQMAATARIYGSARVWWPGNFEMGAECSVGPRVKVYCMGRVRIGDRTVVSHDVHLCAGTHDYTDPNFQLVALPIEIGSDCWIATEAFVGPGAKVGDGVVLGARAVAFGTLEPWTVYRGNPAAAVKDRPRFA